MSSWWIALSVSNETGGWASLSSRSFARGHEVCFGDAQQCLIGDAKFVAERAVRLEVRIILYGTQFANAGEHLLLSALATIVPVHDGFGCRGNLGGLDPR
jgi:hypothetical protein